MKKIIALILLILINSSCSSEYKSIDKKVLKVNKAIDIHPNIKQNLYINCSSEIDALIYFIKIENQIKKINYKIEYDKNCKEYSKEVTVFLENNIPILITETTKAICEHEISGLNAITNKFQSFKEEFKIKSDVKLYVNNWDKFEIKVIGGSKFDYNLKTKEKYQNIINKVLEQEKIK